MSDENDQADEILALKSIYGDKIVSCNTEVKPLRGILLIDVDPHQSFEDGVFEVSVSDNPGSVNTSTFWLNEFLLDFQTHFIERWSTYFDMI